MYTKDPTAVLDYTVDWAAWLDGDTIATATWAVSEGIVIVSETSGPTSATVWLSGGAVGEELTVTSRVVTAAGRTDERSFRLLIQQR